jgi:hypothetical protein
MSPILVEDTVRSFGDLIVSCWDESSRISLLTTSYTTLDETTSLGIKAFEGEYDRRPKHASLYNLILSEYFAFPVLGSV